MLRFSHRAIILSCLLLAITEAEAEAEKKIVTRKLASSQSENLKSGGFSNYRCRAVDAKDQDLTDKRRIVVRDAGEAVSLFALKNIDDKRISGPLRLEGEGQAVTISNIVCEFLSAIL